MCFLNCTSFTFFHKCLNLLHSEINISHYMFFLRSVTFESCSLCRERILCPRWPLSFRPWQRPSDRGRRRPAHHDSLPSARHAPCPDAPSNAPHAGAPPCYAHADPATRAAPSARHLPHGRWVHKCFGCVWSAAGSCSGIMLVVLCCSRMKLILMTAVV